MRLANVKPGDIVECDVKGRRFYALVEGKAGRELSVKPIGRGANFYHPTATDVVGHWRRAGLHGARG